MTQKYYHRKLVRDKIPEKIVFNNGKYSTKIVAKREIEKLLRKKLVEEAREASAASRKKMLNELADVLQITISLAEIIGISHRVLETERKRKAKKVGEYKKGIYFVWSDQPAGQ